MCSPASSRSPMEPDSPRPRIAVVGGGVSGLTAARELAVAGADVVVIEGSERLGGRIRGAALAGTTIDIGAESFATRGGTVAELIDELGLSDQVVRPAPLGSWVIDGARSIPLPAAGTLGIPAQPLSRATVRALGMPGALRAAVEPLLPRSVGSEAGSLAELVRARLGSRALHRLVRPVALGVYSADPERLGVATVPGLAAAYAKRGTLIAAARDLRDGQAAAGGAVAGLRGGMTQLIDGLEADVRRRGVAVLRGTKARRIEARKTAAAGAGTWLVLGDDDAVLAAADRVVLAVPENVARRLVGETGAADQATDRIEVVALAIDDPRLDRAPRGTGALVARDAVGAGARRESGAAPILAKALTHVTAKWPERAREAGPGRHIVRLSYGRAGSAPETVGLDDAEVRGIARYDASRILGVDLRADTVVDLVRCTWRMGRPPGSRDARPFTAPAGVTLAGDWVSGTGLAAIVQGARTAAAAALAASH